MIRATIDPSNSQEEGTPHHATLKVLSQSTFDSACYSGKDSPAESDKDEGRIRPCSPWGKPAHKCTVDHHDKTMHTGNLEDNYNLDSISYSRKSEATITWPLCTLDSNLVGSLPDIALEVDS